MAQAAEGRGLRRPWLVTVLIHFLLVLWVNMRMTEERLRCHLMLSIPFSNVFL